LIFSGHFIADSSIYRTPDNGGSRADYVNTVLETLISWSFTADNLGTSQQAVATQGAHR